MEPDGAGEARASIHPRRRARPPAGRVVFFLDLAAKSFKDFRLYYGNSDAEAPAYPTGLRATKGPAGPQHCWIENEFYRIETMPKSGQIWHVWNRKGSNTSWHHNEWAANIEKGGDPCYWAPNCWVAYPERVTFGQEEREDGDVDVFDWHYVFGWDDPSMAMIAGPLFFEVRRWGPVWPHPEHSNPGIKRDRKERIWAEVVYRFYDGLPWFFQSSRLETLEDLKVFFIRNSQFVFLDRVFTHAVMAPERTGLRPTRRPSSTAADSSPPASRAPSLGAPKSPAGTCTRRTCSPAEMAPPVKGDDLFEFYRTLSGRVWDDQSVEPQRGIVEERKKTLAFRYNGRPQENAR